MGTSHQRTNIEKILKALDKKSPEANTEIFGAAHIEVVYGFISHDLIIPF